MAGPVPRRSLEIIVVAPGVFFQLVVKSSYGDTQYCRSLRFVLMGGGEGFEDMPPLYFLQ